MMGPEELESEFQYLLSLARSHPITCAVCKRQVLLVRDFEPQYHVEKMEEDQAKPAPTHRATTMGNVEYQE